MQDITNLDHPRSQMDQVVDRILLGKGQSRVLIQPSSVLICHTITEQDVQSDNSDLINGSAHELNEVPGMGMGNSRHRPIIK